MADPIRRRLLFTGRVQGVGFRQTTVMIARHYAVTGYVKNLPDGRVEAVIEGERGDIGRFQEQIQAEMARCITDTRAEDAPALGEYSDFGVRY